jgi:cholesterol transport system auxiliary component
MTLDRRLRSAALLLAAGLALAGGGCGSVLPKPEPVPAFYALDGLPAQRTAAPSTAGLTLIVNQPQAVAGFDGQHIVYLRQDHQLEHFAHSVWVDTPARMLAPLIADAVTRGDTIRNAVLPSGTAAAELRLDTQIVRLQQDFSSRPSRVRFTLRATLLDDATRHVLATREFDVSVAAASDDPYGGVVAANQAVHAVLQALAAFCDESARQWQQARPASPLH